ncbi:MAG: CBS domain-containing protein [Phycisphaera sp.]|nr:MAG: CBS domain-containing protein [Phycisphaera sp.]
MRIEDIMTREVITASMDDSLESVRDLFTRYRFRHMPITGDKGELVGIISDRDMLANVSPFAGTINERPADANSLRRKAHQIMSRHPETAPMALHAERAALIMLQQRISALPIVDPDGILVGIVTMRDILRFLLNQCGSSRRSGAA